MSHKIDTTNPSASFALDVVDDRFEPIAKRGQIVIGRYDACGMFRAESVITILPGHAADFRLNENRTA